MSFLPSFSNPFAPVGSSTASVSAESSSSTPTSIASSTSSSTLSSTSSSTSTSTASSSSTSSSTSQSTSPSSSGTSTSSSANTASSSSSASVSSSSSLSSATSGSSTTSAFSNTASSTGTVAPTHSQSPTLATSFTVSVSASVADGTTYFYTSTVPVVSTESAHSAATSGNSSFFNNKGDVAGVFTVVGLVVLGIIVAILTAAVRRRRAKNFDRDAEEAAAEAAAQAHVPDFTDDDYGYSDDRTQQEFGDRGYSDTASHGTYSQPPLQLGESYNMSELPPFDPYAAAGAAGDPYSAAGAAGVGAAGINRARSLGRPANAVPYNAFAGPPVTSIPNPYDNPMVLGAYNAQPINYGPSFGTGNSGDLLEAAGLGGATAGLARGPSQSLASRQSPDGGLARNKSLGATTLGGMSSASEYSSSTSPYPPVGSAYPSAAQPSQPAARPLSMGDPYDGYSAPAPSSNDQQAPTNPFSNVSDQGGHGEAPRLLGGNFSSPDSSAENGYEEDELPQPTAWQGEEGNRMSMRDEEDYGYGGGRRVLKVANE